MSANKNLKIINERLINIMIKNCILIFKFNKKEDDGIIKIIEIVSDYNCYYIIMDTQFNCDIYQYVIGV